MKSSKNLLTRFSLSLIISFLFNSALSANPKKLEETPLNRDVITSFIQVTGKIGKLNKKYPELAKHSQAFNFEQSDAVINFLKNSKAYPEIKSILNDSELNELLQIFELSQKVMGGLYYLNRSNDSSNQSLSQFETIRKVIKENLKTLQKQDEESFSQDNAQLIKESQQQLALLEQQLVIVNQALDSLTDADKTFLDQNAKWFKTQFISDQSNSQ